MTRARALGIAALLATPLPAQASGFLIYEQGPSALAQGGAFVARADDPSAIFYNPAGLADHQHFAVLVGGTGIITTTTASRLPPAGTSTDAQTRLFTPPTIYVSGPIGKRVAVGVGAFTQYGLGLTWPGQWVGGTRIVSADARSLNVNPTVAVQIRPGLYVGGGVSAVYGIFELRRNIDLVQGGGTVHLGGSAMAYGANAGLLWEVVPDHLRLGLAYRSATHLHINDGKADFTVPPEFGDLLHDQPVTAVVQTPHLLALAGSVRTGEHTWLSLDLVYATWQSFQSLTFTFPQNTDLSTSEPQRWHNTLSVRAGGEWAVRGDLRIRAGAGYDASPVPATTLSPVIPDSDRLLLSAGAAYDRGRLRMELGYMAVIFAQRSSSLTDFPARYDSTGHVIGIALQYRR